MTTTYTKSLASDFGGELNPSQLRELIIMDAAITSTLVAIRQADDVVDIMFTPALDGAGVSALDAIIAAYTYQAPHEAVQEVKIMEEEVKTGGRYRVMCHTFTAAANSTTVSDFSYPLPINVISGWTPPDAAHKGDRFCVMVAPDTVIGAVVAPVADTDTTVTVDATAIQNTYAGAHVSFTDGVNTTDLAMVIGYDATAHTLTFQNPIGFNFSPLSPTYVRLTRIYADNLPISGTNKITMGTNKIGTTYIPANIIIRIRYENKQPSAKEVDCYLDYLF
jgi:hypothetical protein